MKIFFDENIMCRKYIKYLLVNLVDVNTWVMTLFLNTLTHTIIIILEKLTQNITNPNMNIFLAENQYVQKTKICITLEPLTQ